MGQLAGQTVVVLAARNPDRLIAPGFVDTPLSASLLGEQLDERRDELAGDAPDRSCRRSRRHSPRSAVHIMINTAVTGRDV